MLTAAEGVVEAALLISGGGGSGGGTMQGACTEAEQTCPAAWIVDGQQLSFVVWSPRRPPRQTSPASVHCERDWPQPSLQQVAPSALKTPSQGGGGDGGGGDCGAGGKTQKLHPRHLHH